MSAPQDLLARIDATLEALTAGGHCGESTTDVIARQRAAERAMSGVPDLLRCARRTIRGVAALNDALTPLADAGLPGLNRAGPMASDIARDREDVAEMGAQAAALDELCQRAGDRLGDAFRLNCMSRLERVEAARVVMDSAFAAGWRPPFASGGFVSPAAVFAGDDKPEAVVSDSPGVVISGDASVTTVSAYAYPDGETYPATLYGFDVTATVGNFVVAPPPHFGGGYVQPPAPGPSVEAGTVDAEEIEDEIEEAIADSLDFDWNARMGARSVMARLKREGLMIVRRDAPVGPLNYRKKPDGPLFSALQVTGDNGSAVEAFVGDVNWAMVAATTKPGEWICTENARDFWIVPGDVFALDYELAPGAGS